MSLDEDVQKWHDSFEEKLIELKKNPENEETLNYYIHALTTLQNRNTGWAYKLYLEYRTELDSIYEPVVFEAHLERKRNEAYKRRS